MTVGKPTRFKFHIDSLTPDTLSMRRLAGYMECLARLVGEEERVHFEGIRPGSAVIVFKADFEATPKVRERIEIARNVAAHDEPGKYARALNSMLAGDNAIGELHEIRRGVVIRFPGREQAAVRIGPVLEDTSIEGTLVRIGGIDRTAHALIETSADQRISCTVTRELARDLSPHLYRNPLRLAGRGKWLKDETGAWQLEDFVAVSFEVLELAPLVTVFQKLASVPGNPLQVSPDALTRWRKLRHGE